MRQVNINIDEELYDKLNLLAFTTKQTKRGIVVQALEKHINQLEKKEAKK